MIFVMDIYQDDVDDRCYDFWFGWWRLSGCGQYTTWRSPFLTDSLWTYERAMRFYVKAFIPDTSCIYVDVGLLSRWEDWVAAWQLFCQCKILCKLSHPGFEAFLLCCSFGISRYAFVSFSVLISTGLNFRLEMPLADAQAFLVDKARHVSQFHVLTVYF